MYQNYTTGQTALTLNLDFTIPSNHLANTISWFVDSIPEDVFLGDTAKTGRPAYHRDMMLRSCFLLIPEEYFQAERLN